MEGQDNQGTIPVANAGAQTNTNGAVTQPAGTQTQQKTEGTVTQTVNKTEGETKTFTQEEVNAMLAKERKKMPDAEDLKAFENWKEAQKTEEQKKQETAIESQRIKAENEQKGQLLEIVQKGVDYETAEFIQFKLSKMEGDFSDNLENYLKNNPIKEKGEKKVTTTGFSQSNTGTNIDQNKDYLDKKYANNPYYKK